VLTRASIVCGDMPASVNSNPTAYPVTNPYRISLNRRPRPLLVLYLRPGLY